MAKKNSKVMSIYNKGKHSFTVLNIKGEVVTVYPNRWAKELGEDEAEKLLKNYPKDWTRSEEKKPISRDLDRKAKELEAKEKEQKKREKELEAKQKELDDYEKLLNNKN